jgi:hypothetical protein
VLAGEPRLVAVLGDGAAYLDFLAAAVDSATLAHDPVAAAYFLCLAARRAPTAAAATFRARADRYLADEARRVQLGERRFVSLREDF